MSVQNAALIRKELRPAQKMAFALQLELKIGGLSATLTAEEHLTQVVDGFLKQPVPTWEKIITALKSPNVDCKELAKSIEDKFCSTPPKEPNEGKVANIIFW